VVWIEALIMFSLWVWSRTQPLAASLTGLVFLLTGAVINLVTMLPFAKEGMIAPLIGQLIGQGIFLGIAIKVVRSSRNPLGPSKLSRSLATNPAPLDPAPQALLEELATREALEKNETASVDDQADPHPSIVVEEEPDVEPARTRLSDRAVAIVGSAKETTTHLVRTSDEWLPSWLQPFPLRVFQAAIVVVVIFQLHRSSTILGGHTGRFSPFPYASLLAPIVALSDLVIGMLVSFRLIKGLVKLIGDTELDREYWLRLLPRLAAMWGGLFSLRVLTTALAVVMGRARFGSPSQDFFLLAIVDLLTAALGIVAYRFWKDGRIPGNWPRARGDDPELTPTD
jgi:hypothetical protein